MKATKLIGKVVIRTARTKGISDGSYTSTPIHIIKATKSHIFYDYTGCGTFEERHLNDNKTGILGQNFCDNKWIDYMELLNGVEEISFKEKVSTQIRLIKEWILKIYYIILRRVNNGRR